MRRLPRGRQTLIELEIHASKSDRDPKVGQQVGIYEDPGGSGLSPIRSLTALRKRCLQPRYRSVVCTETCSNRNWIAPVHHRPDDKDRHKSGGGHRARAPGSYSVYAYPHAGACTRARYCNSACGFAALALMVNEPSPRPELFTFSLIGPVCRTARGRSVQPCVQI